MLARREAASAEDPEAAYAAALAKYRRQCAAEKDEVLEAGGLYILGTERHESRRIDNQLRGRSGRQGDPGESRFYLCLDDDLLRIFGSHRVAFVMEKLRIPEEEPIEHGMISKAIENAQKKVEGHNFDIRKHLLEYDDVMNKQREVIYAQRREVLAGENIRETVEGIMAERSRTWLPPSAPRRRRRPTGTGTVSPRISATSSSSRRCFPRTRPRPDPRGAEEDLKAQVPARLAEQGRGVHHAGAWST